MAAEMSDKTEFWFIRDTVDMWDYLSDVEPGLRPVVEAEIVPPTADFGNTTIRLFHTPLGTDEKTELDSIVVQSGDTIELTYKVTINA